MTPKLFTELGLSPEMLKAIARLGFEQASPIQAETIPLLLAGRDVIGQSQTGSGKTAAFGIPAIERIDPTKPGPQVLILAPTRELAVQVSEEIHKLVFFKRGIRALPIYGGQSYERQFAGLRAGVQIVIGTPGRLMDHLERGTLSLANVRTVILDEADEMLDMGFREDIEFILQRVPEARQTVLFSATIPRPIEELIQRYTRDAQRVRIEAQALTVPTVEQVYFEVDRRWKFEALTRLIEVHDVKLGIIFCNTQRMVDELTEHLNAAGYSADAIHGGMAQAGRDRVMGRFRKGGLEFLVATDVAARGIDVDDIEVVFNFDLPYDAEDYVHRIGRTGRAGRSGLAISFASGRELFAIRQIERYTRQRMRRGQVPSEPEIEQVKVTQLLQRVRSTLTAGDFRHYDHLIEALLEEGFDSMDLVNALFHRLSLGDPELPADPKGKGKAAWPTSGPADGTAAAAPAAARATPAPVQAAPPAAKPVQPRPAAIQPKARQENRGPASDESGERPAHTVASPAIANPPQPANPAPPAKRKFVSNAPAPQYPFPERKDAAPRAPRPAPPSGFTPTQPSPRRTPPQPPAPAAFESDDQDAPDHEAVHDERPMGAGRKGALPHRAPAAQAPAQMVPLWLNVGRSHGVAPANIVGCILGETGLPPAAVGKIEVDVEHSVVDVSAHHARAILSRLNRTQLSGRRLKAKLAH